MLGTTTAPCRRGRSPAPAGRAQRARADAPAAASRAVAEPHLPDAAAGPRPRRPAAVPPRAAPARDHRADLGGAPRDRRGRDPGRAPGPGVVAVPHGPRRDVADAGRDQRHGPPPHRPRGRSVRRGDHRADGGQPRADRRGRHRATTRASCGCAAWTSGGSSRRCCPSRSPGTTRSWASSTSRPRRAAGSPTRTSRSCPPSRTCWRGSSRRAGSSAMPRPRSPSSRPSTRRATS